MTRGALAAALVLAACASGPRSDPVADARRADEDAVAMRDAAEDESIWAAQWIAVQGGAVAATGDRAEDAARSADVSSPGAPHRFVYRPSDRGRRLYRMAYVADGGVVAGRHFLADLGLVATGSAGRASTLRRRGGGAGVDLSRTPRFAIDVASLDGAANVALEVAYDPDFDGGLLVPASVAASLRLERSEIPGGADVMVALGRPFNAVRATAIVTVPALQATAPAEIVFETAAARK